ncbi:hypothetical protein BJ980_002051 [Nocardioides daedukensis]|uniref:Type IV toxin-antitoxin system AbiEi family antitoxin domain-containing protein n=1 Tax=Nocardioides daedukensis TaxID=634462 RepID=A0A7Y9UP18_9ACTN|nr:type IV toxin-antitoxin system AbiEi family antitoxin domain-containing protein [Nocardioides daedukensis]NYG59128.1 hypothetical protein [Nocardioides daedukensis]
MNGPATPDADWGAATRLLAEQDGVISRRQAHTLGLQPHDLERLVRRRVWARVIPGIFVNHTGPPSWQQRAWAGVLHFEPAALAGASALQVVDGAGWQPGPSRQRAPRGRTSLGDAPIEIAVHSSRRVAQLDGYRVVRTGAFSDVVQHSARPPRVRFDEAVLDLAAQAPTDLAAIGVLADACGSRRTTAQRLLATIARRSRLSRRRWLVGVLGDVAAGTCSTLEHVYLDRVQRPHGLPRGNRQASEQTAGGRLFRDVDLPEFDLIIELDGRLFHDSTEQRDRDMDRDLDAAVDGRTSIRLGWGQCTERACRTAGRLARVLASRGWVGEPVRCGPDCALD